jgi:hypothetical protein
MNKVKNHQLSEYLKNEMLGNNNGLVLNVHMGNLEEMDGEQIENNYMRLYRYLSGRVVLNLKEVYEADDISETSYKYRDLGF